MMRIYMHMCVCVYIFLCVMNLPTFVVELVEVDSVSEKGTGISLAIGGDCTSLPTPSAVIVERAVADDAADLSSEREKVEKEQVEEEETAEEYE